MIQIRWHIKWEKKTMKIDALDDDVGGKSAMNEAHQNTTSNNNKINPPVIYCLGRNLRFIQTVFNWYTLNTLRKLSTNVCSCRKITKERKKTHHTKWKKAS